MDSLTFALMAELDKALIAARMRLARKEAGLTQDQMKDLLGVHKRTVENIERNQLKHGPYEYVKPWAQVTERPVTWLLHGDEATEPRAAEAEWVEAVERLEAHLVAIERRLDALQAGEAAGEAGNGPS